MKTILLVDDDYIIRTLIIECLADKYNIIEASHGKEGLNLFKENYSSIDLVITDFMMPIMNGLEMIKAIRTLSQTMKVIMFSGSGNTLPTSLRDSNIKIDGLLSKPINGNEVEKTIDKLLQD